jgi:hypothetical protein
LLHNQVIPTQSGCFFLLLSFGPFGIGRLDWNKEEMYILIHLGLVIHKEKDRNGHGYEI